MTNRDFCRAVGVIETYGREVLVEDNYSEQQLKELLKVLASMLLEADGK